MLQEAEKRCKKLLGKNLINCFNIVLYTATKYSDLAKNNRPTVHFVTAKLSEVPNVELIPKLNSPILCKGFLQHASWPEIKLLHVVNSGIVHACVWRVFFRIFPIFPLALYCLGGEGRPLSTTTLHSVRYTQCSPFACLG